MAMDELHLEKISDYLYEIPKSGGMRVPGRIYATAELMETQKHDEALQQVANVAHLPGIVNYSYAMPDFHWGYGFPIGGVAAFDVDEGVISPGGVGYDINCGVRIMRTSLVHEQVKPQLRDLVRNIFHAIPAGVGSKGCIRTPGRDDAKKIVVEGAAWAIHNGYGRPEDLDFIEERGRLEGADPSVPSDRAYQRGLPQIGTLGSGNHFLEIQVVDEIYWPEAAERLGLVTGGICIAIHSGSRGFGYQICDDALPTMIRASQKYGIALPDRQLCCAPIKSEEAQRYLAAMTCAANYAFVNRQVMMAVTERIAAQTLRLPEDELDMKLIYDVCHNIAKFETHEGKTVCVHRKGATRALGPGHPLTPAAYRNMGQPVFIPGDMGRNSFLLIGMEQSVHKTFGSTCHGAGRRQSRSAMLKSTKGRDLVRELEQERGVIVYAHGRASIAEEMPEAYKDAGLVVDVMEKAGISRKVVKLRPLGCVKG